MGDRAWLDGYSGQATAELLALEGSFRADSIALAFEAAVGAKGARIGAAALTWAEQVVLAVEAVEREVNSGGYFALFDNAPEEVPNAVLALEAIARPDLADLTRRALSAIGFEGPVTEDAVTTAVEAAAQDDNDERDEMLSGCDDQYFASAGDLADALLAFIRLHQHEIVIP